MSGGILGLLADRLTQDINLYTAGLLSQLRSGLETAGIGVQGVDEADGEAAGGTETGTGGDIRNGDDLNTAINANQFEGGFHNRMNEIINASDYLRAGVADPDGAIKAAVDGDIHIFTDGGADNGSRLKGIEFTEVRAATGKTDSEGGAGDDQRPPPCKQVSKPCRLAKVPIS